MGVIVCSFILGVVAGVVAAVAYAEWMDQPPDPSEPFYEDHECNDYTPGTKEK